MGTDGPGERDLARDYLSIWNDRRYDLIPDLVADSFVMHDPFAPARDVPGPKGEVHGPDALETFVRGVVAGFPDFHVSVASMAVDGDWVLYEGTLELTHEGSFFGIPPTGRHAAVRYMGAIDIDGDRVVTHRVFPPVLDLARALVPRFPAILGYLPRLVMAILRWLSRRL